MSADLQICLEHSMWFHACTHRVWNEVRLWSRREGFTDPAEEPRLHAVGATGARGTGKSRTAWLSVMRQEAGISEITGQSSKRLSRFKRFLCWSFWAESFIFLCPWQSCWSG